MGASDPGLGVLEVLELGWVVVGSRWLVLVVLVVPDPEWAVFGLR